MTSADDARLGCFHCRGRFAPQLMHRAVFDHVQQHPVSRELRDREQRGYWYCPSCWRLKFESEADPAC